MEETGVRSTMHSEKADGITCGPPFDFDLQCGEGDCLHATSASVNDCRFASVNLLYTVARHIPRPENSLAGRSLEVTAQRRSHDSRGLGLTNQNGNMQLQLSCMRTRLNAYQGMHHAVVSKASCLCAKHGCERRKRSPFVCNVGQYLAVPWKRHIPRLVSKDTLPFSRPRRLSAILKMDTRSKLGLLHNETPR